jgi:hypothetical protein
MNVIIANRYQAMLNTLKIDVIKRLDGEYSVDEIIKQFQNFYFQRMILDITAIKDYKDLKNIQKLSISLDMSKVILLLDDSTESKDSKYLSKLIAMGIYNFATNAEGIVYLYDHPNSYRDVAQYQQLDDTKEVVVDHFDPGKGTKIIGIKNANAGAGSTTFIYAMKKQLSQFYTVGAIEVGKRDFAFFNDKDMISCHEADLGNTIARMNSKDIILVDINNSTVASGMCHDTIYLLEPSTIKINKMLMLNRKSLADLKGKKVVLNQSMLSSKDVLDFEYESKLDIFYNMPPLDEREKDIKAMDPFLLKLGFDKLSNGTNAQKNQLLGLFGI